MSTKPSTTFLDENSASTTFSSPCNRKTLCSKEWKTGRGGSEAGETFCAEGGGKLVPGGDIGLDIGKAVLGRLFNGNSDNPVTERLENLSDTDREKLADLLTDILALSEVVSLAKADGEIDDEEMNAITEAIAELRQETETLLGA